MLLLLLLLYRLLQLSQVVEEHAIIVSVRGLYTHVRVRGRGGCVSE